MSSTPRSTSGPGLAAQRAQADGPALSPEAQLNSATTERRAAVLEPDVSGHGPRKQPASKLKKAVWSVLTLAASASAGWLYYHGSLLDEGHPQWKFVAQANRSVPKDDATAHIQVDNLGKVAEVTAVFIGADDRDQPTTVVMRRAYAANSAQETPSQAEVNALRQAQNIPEVDDPLAAARLPRKDAVLTKALRDAIGAGGCEFFHLHIADSCDEDGDVVELLIAGQPFATIPLTNQGADLSIPLGADVACAVKGVSDGGGGITVSLRTSQGQFFCSALQVGKTYSLEIVPR